MPREEEDFFARFGTSTQAVIAWAGAMGCALSNDHLATAAKPPTKAAAQPLTTEQWKAKIDIKTYRRGRKLGSGNFGDTHIFASTDPRSPPLVVKTPNANGEAELAREEAFYKKVGDHPNFAKCLGLQNIDGKDCLVLEHVKGKNMKHASESLRAQFDSGQLSTEEFWGATQYMISNMLKAAAHLESVGVVHNDLRLDNVMCDDTTGDLKVIDFGVAVDSAAGEKESRAPFHAGTVSPDMAVNQMLAGLVDGIGPPVELTAKHDVFSVGATAYHIGEQAPFGYLDPSNEGQQVINASKMYEFAAPDEQGHAKQAIQQVPTGQASAMVDGKRTKKTGAAAAQTKYTEFVNWLMAPRDNLRPTAAMALEHPFLTEGLLDEEAARGALTKALSPQSQAIEHELDRARGMARVWREHADAAQADAERAAAAAAAQGAPADAAAIARRAAQIAADSARDADRAEEALRAAEAARRPPRRGSPPKPAAPVAQAPAAKAAPAPAPTGVPKAPPLQDTGTGYQANFYDPFKKTPYATKLDPPPKPTPYQTVLNSGQYQTSLAEDRAPSKASAERQEAPANATPPVPPVKPKSPPVPPDKAT